MTDFSETLVLTRENRIPEKGARVASSRFVAGHLRYSRVMVFSICVLGALMAPLSVGSRVQDATLSEDMRAKLVMASVQQSNPSLRNVVMTDIGAPHAPSVARFDADVLKIWPMRMVTPPVPEGQGNLEYQAPETPALSAAVTTSPRPMARDDAAMAVLTKVDVRLSTQGAGIATPRFNRTFAPHSSTRPMLRPAALERRVVQYNDRWLRTLDLRPLNDEKACLATAIYHEARGESLRGQFAVAEVILNRVDSRKFPNSICAVVYQGVRAGRMGGCQFSFACDGNSEAMPNRKAASRAQRIAQVMVEGGHRGLTQGALYFHTTAVNPSWAHRFTQTTHIGAHLFYRG
ncbi:MAG: cell wall hydrolase [Roseinatronobacter sp.]